MNIRVGPFEPNPASTVAMTATTGSTRLQFGTNNSSFPNSTVVRIYNVGPSDCAIEFGGSSVTATFPVGSTASSMVIKAATSEKFKTRQSFIAGICSSSTATIQVTPGDGSV